MEKIIYKNFDYKIKNVGIDKITLEPLYLEDICYELKIENPESKRPKITTRLKVRKNPSFIIKRNKKGSYIVVDSKRYYLKEYIEKWFEEIKRRIL